METRRAPDWMVEESEAKKNVLEKPDPVNKSRI